MKKNRILGRASAALLWALLLTGAPALLDSCQHDDVVAPAGTVPDDHGSGGHGSDDPPGDDHGDD